MEQNEFLNYIQDFMRKRNPQKRYPPNTSTWSRFTDNPRLTMKKHPVDLSQFHAIMMIKRVTYCLKVFHREGVPAFVSDLPTSAQPDIKGVPSDEHSKIQLDDLFFCSCQMRSSELIC